jgi:hypothetical protein
MEARGYGSHYGAGRAKALCWDCRRPDAEEVAVEASRLLLDRVTEMVLGHRRGIERGLEIQISNAIDTELGRRRASVIDSAREELEKQRAIVIDNVLVGRVKQPLNVGGTAREELEMGSASTLRRS